MTKSSLDRIQDRIQAFVVEITAIVDEAVRPRVARARTTAAKAAAPRASRQPVTLSRPARAAVADGRGRKRSDDELEQLKESLLEVIQLNPGQRIEELGRLLRMPTKELTLPAKRLLGERSVRTTGQKRATAYWAR